MSLSKKEQIDEFVEELDKKIYELEDYETPYETEVNEIVLENLNDETILEIQKRYIDEQTDNIFKMIKSDGKLSQLLQNATDRAVRAKEKLNSVKRLQQYFTPEKFVRKLLDCSKLLKGYQKLNIDVFATSNGARVSSIQGVYAGSRLSYSELSAGVYIFRVTSSDGKLSYQFKMIKL
jgi:hypothetical protein